MTKDFISSESDQEENAGEQRQVLVLRPLRWRSSKIDRFFAKIDKKLLKDKSKQSKHQTLPRVVGSYSSRPKPSGFDEDFFGFRNADDDWLEL